MKKLDLKSIFVVFIITIIISLFFVSKPALHIRAATDSADLKPATASASSSDIIDKLKKIELLKEKIATKVSELRNKERSVLSGSIKQINKNTITVATAKGDSEMTLLEDSVIYSATDGGKMEPSGRKLKTGDLITAFGYNNQSISAFEVKYVYIIRMIKRNVGKIMDIDKSNYTVTLKETQLNTLVDIETYTKIFIYTKGKGLLKAGFSKLKVGDLAFATGIQNSKDENRISATRINVISFGNQESSPSLTAK